MEECAQMYEGAFAEGDPEAPSKSLEKRNVAAVKAMVEAVARDDYDALSRVVADGVQLQILALRRALHTNAEGAPASRRRSAQLRDARRAEARGPVDRGSRGCRGLHRARAGRYVEDGRGYDLHAVQEFVFREGKLARIFEIAPDRDAAGACVPLPFVRGRGLGPKRR
jgi:hypothetical protein